jgi:hypothetical protein
VSDPVVVRRVRDECGSHIEPDFDESWDRLTKLRWNLAVTLLDAGLPPDAAEVYAVRTVGGERYGLRRAGWSMGTFDYYTCWRNCVALGWGARLAREAADRG